MTAVICFFIGTAFGGFLGALWMGLMYEDGKCEECRHGRTNQKS